MMIEQLTLKESYDLLARSHTGRLGCARDNRPYVVPFSFVYHERCLYGFSTVGQKIEWMRTNPLVCVEVEDITDERCWSTVIAAGQYEELPDCAECEPTRILAWELLQRRANWWEPGYVKTVIGGEERPLSPVFFRIHLMQISGRRLMPEPPATRPISTGGFWSRLLSVH